MKAKKTGHLLSWSPKLGKALGRGRKKVLKDHTRESVDHAEYQKAFKTMAESKVNGKSEKLSRSILDTIQRGDDVLRLKLSVNHALDTVEINDKSKRTRIIRLSNKMMARGEGMNAFGRSVTEPDIMMSELKTKMLEEFGGDHKAFKRFWRPLSKSVKTMQTSREFDYARARVLKSLFPEEEVKIVTTNRWGRTREEFI